MKRMFILVLCSWFSTVQLGKSNAQTESLTNKVQSSYRIKKYVIGTGGVTRAIGNTHSQWATAGEVIVGDMHGANNLLLSGFWHNIALPITKVDQKETENLPLEFKLYQNYPNPFNPQTSIHYELPDRNVVTVEVINLKGQGICSLVNQEIQGPGHMEVIWNGQDDHGRNVGSGVYLYRITVSTLGKDGSIKKETFQYSKKMLLVK